MEHFGELHGGVSLSRSQCTDKESAVRWGHYAGATPLSVGSVRESVITDIDDSSTTDSKLAGDVSGG